MEFKVKGVTFKNEDGRDIQSIIKKEIKALKEQGLLEEQYEGYNNKEIKEMDLNVQQYPDIKFFVKIKKDIFENKPCIKVYIQKEDGNYVHVGYVPKNLIKDIESNIENTDEIIGTAELTGGKYKRCRYYEEDYKEKIEVETVDLDYGLLVSLKTKNEDRIEENQYNSTIKENELKDNIINESNNPKEKESIYKKWWFWLIIVLLVLGLFNGF